MPLFGCRKMRHGFGVYFCTSVSCRTGLLRGGRPLRGLYTLFGDDDLRMPSRGSGGHSRGSVFILFAWSSLPFFGDTVTLE
jgi:hypothetical protein